MACFLALQGEGRLWFVLPRFCHACQAFVFGNKYCENKHISDTEGPERERQGEMMQNRSSVLRAGCKVNLYLHITGVRQDGWHELDTVFWPLPEPYDLLRVTLRSAEGGAVAVSCNTVGIDPEQNTLTKACGQFAAASGFSPSLEIELEKGIPHGAGLGGGSSDAAVLLRWLNMQAPQPLKEESLVSVAASVGADVPFFLFGCPCRARGIGEKLVPCSPLEYLRDTGAAIVLICPAEQVSTPWAYRAWDQWQNREPISLTKGKMGGIGRTSLPALEENGQVLRFENSFEPPVFEAFPRLRHLKEKLLQYGAAAAVMSGSGSSLFGLFRSVEVARSAAEAVQEKDVDVYVHAL